MSLPLEDYAMIGNCHTAALVSRHGSIDWLCLPRFDSSACFAALLGDETHGHWSLCPRQAFDSQRSYVEGTLVMQTEFTTAQGCCRLTDGMLMDTGQPILIRIIEGLKGEVAMDLSLVIRFDYGSVVPWVRRLDEKGHCIHAVAGPDALVFHSDVPLHGHNLHTEAQFTVKGGQRLAFVMAWHASQEPRPVLPENAYHALRRTIYYWKEWADRNQDQGGVLRSLVTLKGLTYRPTGGIVAAPTTSLPERPGGDRNWDYRYCWLRDSTFTLYSLLTAGYREEAEAWRQWLLRAIAGTPRQLRIMYGLCGERRLSETNLDGLPGYEDSSPVRIGNAAHLQLQLDVFGEVMDTLHLGLRVGLPQSSDAWRLQRKLLDYLETVWHEPDEGIWEVRGPRRHFTHSKVMAWVAVDRAIKSAETFKLDGHLEAWRKLRERIRQDILTHGYNAELGSFVQSYGSRDLDASLLMIGLVGFLKADDPRVVGTIRAVEKELLQDGLVRRYRPRQELDGLAGEEGTFLACSFWLVDNYVLLGRRQEAHELYSHLISLRNDVGLFAEEYCPDRRRLVGNFPQAFSHIAHVNSAYNLFKPRGPAGDRSDAGRL
ncbi:MAG TPA: glycoside hydrolase family 15 protein [Oligoflexus sp.]|uniref:glycoside hydrolase family 15 protein n=1 Tax=Oligoflexus sp. TaxID=1971216 RepID=UPI002D7F9374|nr:glycoside hydrolase family 15 protein [Oligoflexus sp.]HET9240128.1 glycoside hydrolase family 15 protein [Oligoflexus sp.]